MLKDKIDQSIINVLTNNARQSYAEISRQVNLSPSAVAERIQRLEENDIIQGYTPILNYCKLGYQITAYITITFRGTGCAMLRRDADQFEEFIECSRVTGQAGMIIKVAVRDNTHLEELIDRLYKYGETCTHIVLSNVIT